MLRTHWLMIGGFVFSTLAGAKGCEFPFSKELGDFFNKHVQVTDSGKGYVDIEIGDLEKPKVGTWIQSVKDIKWDDPESCPLFKPSEMKWLYIGLIKEPVPVRLKVTTKTGQEREVTLRSPNLGAIAYSNLELAEHTKGRSVNDETIDRELAKLGIKNPKRVELVSVELTREQIKKAVANFEREVMGSKPGSAGLKGH